MSYVPTKTMVLLQQHLDRTREYSPKRARMRDYTIPIFDFCPVFASIMYAGIAMLTIQ